VLGKDGKAIRESGMHSDVTKERQYSEELKAARQEAEQASKAKAEFLANMSYEIRTPLNGIVGVADLLQNTELSEKQQQYIDILQSSSITLYETVNEVLDFSKIEAGQLSIEMLGFDLAKTATEAVELTQHQARQKKALKVRMQIAPELPARFISDPTRIRQCLLNLLSNAVKFTSQGEVLLSVDGKKLDETHYEVIFSVTDSGIGIAQDKLKTVFEKFSQADNSTTRQYGGTGLGLAIVQTITKMLGGKVSVKSTLGVGTCFSIVIPLEVDKTQQALISDRAQSSLASSPQATNSAQDATKNTATLRILIVEDNPTNQQVLSWIFDDMGYQYAIANHGQKALDILAQGHAFDAILMDCQMPVMDGFEATLKIRKMPSPACDIPIIALSANANKEDQDKAKNMGMNAFLTKPVDPKKLQETLHAYIGTPANITEPTESKNTSEKIIDTKQLAGIIGASKERLERFCTLFESTYDEALIGLTSALTQEDTDSISRHAHTLKGAAANLHALEIKQLAFEIEQMAKRGAFDEIATAIEALKTAMPAYLQALAQYKSTL
jgi:CheY-like chemotaxis protein/HPt (histidine-containing phosphotransfer) domain-containing protein